METQEFVQAGVAEGWVRETGDTNTIRLGGENESCPIYLVRVDKLHYNVQNGRIATFVSRYHSEHGQLPEDPDERDKEIEHMIEEDNPKRLRATKLDIKTKGQQEPAIILTNGIVIDGNRRFTCLRQLSHEEAEPRFMRCYVFPDTYDAKAIKGLELEVQFGRDEKLNYDAISRLVDINSCVNEGLMSPEEYARYAGMKRGEIKKYLLHIDLINEFLEMVDAPGAYYIAQDLRIQGPIESLGSKLSRCKNDDEREDLKSIVFANIIMQNVGDRTREMRETMDDFIASLRHGDAFAEEQLDIAERVFDRVAERSDDEKVTTDFIRDYVAADEELKQEQNVSRDRARRKADNRKVKDMQVQNVSDAIENLEAVEVPLLPKLSDAQLAEMRDKLRALVERAEELGGEVTEELKGRL